MKRNPMNEIANAMAFAQDVVELARKHGLIRAGRKAAAPRAVAKAPRKARGTRSTTTHSSHANGAAHDDFNALTE